MRPIPTLKPQFSLVEQPIHEPPYSLIYLIFSFLALAFVSSQFINYFSYTKLGTIIALAGASFLKSINIGLIPLIVIFVLFTAFMNLFMGSASAKWNILAPVFVPMFMLLGYSPELCQLAYRIGDSCTNIITPMMTYYAVIIIFAQRYDKKAGIGTITATMLPYSICFLICWTIMLIIWLSIGIGYLGCLGGLFLSYQMQVPSGAAIIFFSILVYALCKVGKTIYLCKRTH